MEELSNGYMCRVDRVFISQFKLHAVQLIRWKQMWNDKFLPLTCAMERARLHTSIGVHLREIFI